MFSLRKLSLMLSVIADILRIEGGVEFLSFTRDTSFVQVERGLLDVQQTFLTHISLLDVQHILYCTEAKMMHTYFQDVLQCTIYVL